MAADLQPLREATLEQLPAVGVRRAEVLRTLGIRKVQDLLYVFPARYQDRSRESTVAALTLPSPPVVLRGRLKTLRSRLSAVRRLEVTEGVLDDGTAAVQLVWFGRVGVAQRFQRGDSVVVFGQPRMADGRMRIDSPEIRPASPSDAADQRTVVPLYPPLGSLAPSQVRRIVERAFELSSPIFDPVPSRLLRSLQLPSRAETLAAIHFPADASAGPLEREAAPRKRLAFDEFLAYQLMLGARRSPAGKAVKPRKIRVTDEMRDVLRRMLPFRLTRGQKQALREIATDLQGPAPMYRLLQGDVGSGKTIVALLAAGLVNLNRHQTVLLAPTEILADQHYLGIDRLVAGSGLSVARLTGSTPTAERTVLLRRLAKGEIDLLVGTHAVLEKSVRFCSLGLVIIDEQHRFGVLQRRALAEKGELVDVLAMTATPIPRSLALSIYGDMSVSSIEDLPPGRVPVQTSVSGNRQTDRVLERVAAKLADGGRAYLVFPAIEESDRVQVTALTAEVERIRGALAPASVGVLHGKMTSGEKELAMRDFVAGRTVALVATTVVEVGLDVPEADIIVIFGADRYGLAQLHQLRGRVGRGSRPGSCVLLRDERATEEAKRRLRDFASTVSGFEVAERDLAERGAGDLLGTRQAGLPRFRIADLKDDVSLMIRARDAAKEIRPLRNEDAEELARRVAPWMDWPEDSAQSRAG